MIARELSEAMATTVDAFKRMPGHDEVKNCLTYRACLYHI